MLVAAGEGIIELREVQPESKRHMDAGQFIRGYNIDGDEFLE